MDRCFGCRRELESNPHTVFGACQFQSNPRYGSIYGGWRPVELVICDDCLNDRGDLISKTPDPDRRPTAEKYTHPLPLRTLTEYYIGHLLNRAATEHEIQTVMETCFGKYMPPYRVQGVATTR